MNIGFNSQPNHPTFTLLIKNLLIDLPQLYLLCEIINFLIFKTV
jgi:hypothetical protein